VLDDTPFITRDSIRTVVFIETKSSFNKTLWSWVFINAYKLVVNPVVW